jgi:hypothetical protein
MIINHYNIHMQNFFILPLDEKISISQLKYCKALNAYIYIPQEQLEYFNVKMDSLNIPARNKGQNGLKLNTKPTENKIVGSFGHIKFSANNYGLYASEVIINSHRQTLIIYNARYRHGIPITHELKITNQDISESSTGVKKRHPIEEKIGILSKPLTYDSSVRLIKMASERSIILLPNEIEEILEVNSNIEFLRTLNRILEFQTSDLQQELENKLCQNLILISNNVRKKITLHESEQNKKEQEKRLQAQREQNKASESQAELVNLEKKVIASPLLPLKIKSSKDTDNEFEKSKQKSAVCFRLATEASEGVAELSNQTTIFILKKQSSELFYKIAEAIIKQMIPMTEDVLSIILNDPLKLDLFLTKLKSRDYEFKKQSVSRLILVLKLSNGSKFPDVVLYKIYQFIVENSLSNELILELLKIEHDQDYTINSIEDQKLYKILDENFDEANVILILNHVKKNKIKINATFIDHICKRFSKHLYIFNLISQIFLFQDENYYNIDMPFQKSSELELSPQEWELSLEAACNLRIAHALKIIQIQSVDITSIDNVLIFTKKQFELLLESYHEKRTTEIASLITVMQINSYFANKIDNVQDIVYIKYLILYVLQSEDISIEDKQEIISMIFVNMLLIMKANTTSSSKQSEDSSLSIFSRNMFLCLPHINIIIDSLLMHYKLNPAGDKDSILHYIHVIIQHIILQLIDLRNLSKKFEQIDNLMNLYHKMDRQYSEKYFNETVNVIITKEVRNIFNYTQVSSGLLQYFKFLQDVDVIKTTINLIMRRDTRLREIKFTDAQMRAIMLDTNNDDRIEQILFLIKFQMVEIEQNTLRLFYIPNNASKINEDNIEAILTCFEKNNVVFNARAISGSLLMTLVNVNKSISCKIQFTDEQFNKILTTKFSKQFCAHFKSIIHEPTKEQLEKLNSI